MLLKHPPKVFKRTAESKPEVRKHCFLRGKSKIHNSIRIPQKSHEKFHGNPIRNSTEMAIEIPRKRPFEPNSPSIRTGLALHHSSRPSTRRRRVWAPRLLYVEKSKPQALKVEKHRQSRSRIYPVAFLSAVLLGHLLFNSR